MTGSTSRSEDARVAVRDQRRWVPVEHPCAGWTLPSVTQVERSVDESEAKERPMW